MSNLLTVPDHPKSEIDANQADTLQKRMSDRLKGIGERILHVEGTEDAPKTENDENKRIASRN